MNKYIFKILDVFIIFFINLFFLRIFTLEKKNLYPKIYNYSEFVNLDYFTNYFQFFLVFIFTLIILFFFYKKKISFSKLIFFSIKKNLYFKNEKVNFFLIFVIYCLLFKFNDYFINLSNEVGESEFWGYLPTLKMYGFNGFFLNHGLTDFLPAVFAENIFGEDKIIIVTRLINNFFIPSFNLGIIILISQIIINYFTEDKYKITFQYFYLFLILLLDQIFFLSTFHDLIYLLNILTLVSGFIDKNYNKISFIFILSILTFLSFFYNYERFLYLIIINIFFFTILVFNKKIFLKQIINYIALLVLFIFLFSLIFNYNFLIKNFNNIYFLITEGHKCCYIPGIIKYTPYSGNYSLIRILFHISLVFTCSSILILILLKKKNSDLINFFYKYLIEIIILISWMLYSRILIYHNDVSHLLQSQIFFPIILLLIILNKFLKLFLKNFKLIFFVIFLVFYLTKFVDVGNKIYNYKFFITKISKHNDKNFFNKVLESNHIKELNNDLKNQECIFSANFSITINYILKKAGCSKYHFQMMAQSPNYQKKTIEELIEKKPELIIFQNNNYTSNNNLGVTFQNSNYHVYDFILKKYSPYKILNNNWFWKLDKNLKNFEVEKNVIKNISIIEIKEKITFINKVKIFFGSRNNIFKNVSDYQIQIKKFPNDKMYNSVFVFNKNELISAQLLDSNKNYINIPKINKNGYFYDVNSEFDVYFFNMKNNKLKYHNTVLIKNNQNL